MWSRVPDRLEHAVGEAQRDQVLDRLAPEEVVDPEDALLVEDAVHELVERDRALEVDAERLLEHHPRAVVEARAAERRDRRAERVRRDREVVEPARRVAELLLGLGHGLDEREGSSALKALNSSRSAKRSKVSPAALPIAFLATSRKSLAVPPLREVPMIL